MDAFEKKSTALELELVNARKDHDKTILKMREFEHKCSQLGQDVKRCLFWFHFSCFKNRFSSSAKGVGSYLPLPMVFCFPFLEFDSC